MQSVMKECNVLKTMPSFAKCNQNEKGDYMETIGVRDHIGTVVIHSTSLWIDN